jgi:hypothetical protein
VTANFSMGKDPNRPPLQPADFFPSLGEAEPAAMSDDQILAVCLTMRAGRSGEKAN